MFALLVFLQLWKQKLIRKRVIT